VSKEELVQAVAERAGLPRAQAALAVGGILGAVRDALAQGGQVRLVGFGTFEVRDRAARKGRDPRTGTALEIPARRVPVFRPGRNLVRALKT